MKYYVLITATLIAGTMLSNYIQADPGDVFGGAATGALVGGLAGGRRGAGIGALVGLGTGMAVSASRDNRQPPARVYYTTPNSYSQGSTRQRLRQCIRDNDALQDENDALQTELDVARRKIAKLKRRCRL